MPKGLRVALYTTGPGLGLIMYIFTTIKFPTYNFNFHIYTLGGNRRLFLELERFRLRSFTFVLFLKPYSLIQPMHVISKQLSQRRTQFKA